MNTFCIGDYKRISKARAKKLYCEGKVVRLCPVKMSPVHPYWRTYTDIFPLEKGLTERELENMFESAVNSFTWYNCTPETGTYPAFYVKE